MEKKTARETLESMRPTPENESPRRSWLFIFVAVVVIFGLTFLFQYLNEEPASNVDPYSFDQLKDQIQGLRMEVSELQEKNRQLEERIDALEK